MLVRAFFIFGIIFIISLVGKSIFINTMAFITQDCEWYLTEGNDQIEANSNFAAYNSCIVDKYLQKNKDVDFDYVSDINFEQLSLKSIPFFNCTHGVVSGDQVEACEKMSNDFKMNFEYPDVKFKNYSNNTFEITYNSNLELVASQDSKGNYTSDYIVSDKENYQIKQLFSIEGYADINNDNYLDMIIVITDLFGGTMLVQTPIILTRFSANTSLKLIN